MTLAPRPLLRQGSMVLYAVLLSLVLVLPVGALEAPPLKGRINDYAGMLSPAVAASLEQKLAAFERETTTQVVLLTVPTLGGDVIENLAIRVADAWKIGQKEKGNGVILILAKKERKIRIEVGTGLQGVLPDITAGQIIRNVMAPALKAGDTDKGISAGLAAIMDATRGEFKATPADKKAKKKKSSGYELFIVLLLAGIVVVAAVGSSSRTGGALAGGAALPAAAAIGLGSALWKLAILAVLGTVAGFLISLLMQLFRGGGGGYSGWGGGPTIFYGGGGGGSSSSDDGFSGGGGDFDGGGASDDY